MPNQEIEKVVDGLIQSGRVSREHRDFYVGQLESGLGDHLLRGSDYTKKTQELAEARRQFDQQVAQERAKLTERQQKLENWYNGVENDLRSYDHLKQEAAAYKQKLQDYNIYDEAEQPRQTNPTPRQPVDPRQTQLPAEKRPLTVEEGNRFASDMLLLQSKLNRIQNEHFRVFGQPLPADEDLVAHFMKTGDDPELYWRTKYNVEGKKAELESQSRLAYEEKIRAEERAKVMAEMTSDPNRVLGAPVLGRQGGVSPLLEAYSQSKATQHSQNRSNEDLATGMVPKQDGERLNPERINEIPAAMDRINSAASKFRNMFSDDGTPVSEEGKAAFRKHFVSDVY
jgi:hypothetical protein